MVTSPLFRHRNSVDCELRLTSPLLSFICNQLHRKESILMRIPKASEVLDRLLNSESLALRSIVGGGGIYALQDELGVVRYIGKTDGQFRKRIESYHCNGDDNSHKYSTIFNAGRLWHMSQRDINPVKRAVCNQADGKVSKELRRLYARSRCRARTCDLSYLSKQVLSGLELSVLEISPTESKLWNKSRNLSAYEPEDLDYFIETLSWPTVKIDAINRQKIRWNSLAQEDRVVVRSAG
jgi:hypothetical protein